MHNLLISVYIDNADEQPITDTQGSNEQRQQCHYSYI